MRIRVLGSGAGGGFPQWNCNCVNCRAVRGGAPGFVARTQSSLAVSADDERWLVLDASPDLRHQIAATPRLAPPANGSVRASPLRAVALTSGEVDHIAGLLDLREAQPFSLYAAQRVLDILRANVIFEVLAPEWVPRVALPLGEPMAILGAGAGLGLSIEAIPTAGKVALYLEDLQAPDLGSRSGDTLGLRIVETSSGKAFFYIPGCARVDEALAARLRGAALVLFDGTLWRDNEMIEQGLTGKTGARMGHISISGPGGSIAAFARLDVARKIFVHINNSNPVLDPASRERRAATAAGWEIAEDGMEIVL